jgi:hypothetical protein
MALALILALHCTGCATSGQPMQIKPTDGGALVGVDVSQGPGVLVRAAQWVGDNPGKVAVGLGAAYGAWRVADHNDWFGGGSDGDRRATSTLIEVTGDNNRIVVVSDQGTGSASGDSNTGSGGQANGDLR